MLFIDFPDMEVGHILPQALLKPFSRSPVTSPFFLTLVQRLTRQSVVGGHSAGGDKKMTDWVFSETPDRRGISIPRCTQGGAGCICA